MSLVAVRDGVDALAREFEREAARYVAPTYCRTRRSEFVLQRMLVPEVFNRSYDRALDIGCGVGFKSLLLGDVAHAVDGVDIDVAYHGFQGHEPAAMAGQSILDRIGCGWARLTAAPDFPAYLRARRQQYDLIVSDYLVEHIRDTDDFHRAVFDALRPGGVVVHTIPNSHDAVEQFVRLNVRTSLREIGKAVLGVMRFGRRAQKITLRGLLVPITHSEFLADYGRQFDVYRLEQNVFPMIEAGFEIVRIQPTREHSYTVAARRPA